MDIQQIVQRQHDYFATGATLGGWPPWTGCAPPLKNMRARSTPP